LWEFSDYALSHSWERFTKEAKYVSRYFVTSLTATDDWRRDNEFSAFTGPIGEGAEVYSPRELLECVGNIIRQEELIRPLPPGADLYRVRIHPRDMFLSSPRQLGTAPTDAAFFSTRMSPAGIPMFYAADSREAALVEAYDVVPAGKVATVARFTPGPGLRVVDLTALPSMPSILDKAGETRRPLLRFLIQFAAEISKPIERDGREHIQYVPTQLVTDFIRIVLGHGQPQGTRFEYFQAVHGFPNEVIGYRDIDGIVYSSSKVEKAQCYVLFIGNSECVVDGYQGLHPCKRVCLDLSSIERIEL
jgi:hypothetical protein